MPKKSAQICGFKYPFFAKRTQTKIDHIPFTKIYMPGLYKAGGVKKSPLLVDKTNPNPGSFPIFSSFAFLAFFVVVSAFCLLLFQATPFPLFPPACRAEALAKADHPSVTRSYAKLRLTWTLACPQPPLGVFEKLT
ncbi:MAG TPA: hypothetical protein VGI03_14780 [Verrucomicrobiae bacterium]